MHGMKNLITGEGGIDNSREYVTAGDHDGWKAAYRLYTT